MKKLLLFLAPLLSYGQYSDSLYAQQKHALLIGISDYGNERENPDEWANISGANDVQLLAPLLSEQGFEVQSLVDAEATNDGITKKLEEVTKSSKKGDVVYLHFSMHGQPVEDMDGDEEDGWDEALIPVDAKMKFQKGVYEGESHLLDDMLEKYFAKIRTKIGPDGMLYVVLDACHSGTASRGDDDHVRGVNEGFTSSEKLYTPDRAKETNDYFTVETMSNQSPIVLLEACRSYQQNKEVLDAESKMWYGSLSYYISQTLKECSIDKSDDWVETVRGKMAGDRRLRRQNMVIESSKPYTFH